ncbi:MAG TPA: calcium-binding protein [Chroococcidiopsis sp.]
MAEGFRETEGYIDLAASEDGQFVVLWKDAQNGLVAQKYSNQGVAQGSQLTVAQSNVGNCCCEVIGAADVDMDADGDFVVTWGTYGDNSESQITSVFAQQYTSQGVAGNKVTVDTTTSTYLGCIQTCQSLNAPKVAVDDDGDFVIAWEYSSYMSSYTANTLYTSLTPYISINDQPSETHQVRGQRYSSAGAAQGSQIQIVSPIYVNGVDVDADDVGNFAIAWTEGGEGSGTVKTQLFSQAGVAGPTVTVASACCGSSISDPDLAMDDEGDFVVTWKDYNYSSIQPQVGLYAQAYNSDGAVQGDRLTVATTTGCCDSLFSSAIAADENGDFVITWAQGNYFGAGVYAQLYQVPDPETDLVEEGEEEVAGTPNNDRLEGTDGNDIIKGFGGNDTLIGGDGDDYIAGQQNEDRIFCGDGDDNGFGGAGNDRIYGNNGDDLLAGGGGRDVIVGGDGADFIDGGYGADVLVGGAGADRFFFFKARGAVDKILDFDVTEDLILVNQSKFRTTKNPKALPLGVLAEERLFIGSTAPTTTDACFIYNDQNGDLLFDSNGAGVGGRSKIAKLSKGLELTSQNFLVV